MEERFLERIRPFLILKAVRRPDLRMNK